MKRKSGSHKDETEKEEHAEKKLKENEEEHAEGEKPAKRGRGRPKGKSGKGKGKGEKESATEVGGEVVAETSTKEAHQTITLERGHIFFFYRPKVELEEASSLDEVQRFYMVLRPEDNREHDAKKEKDRLIVITKKVLPAVASRAKHWGFVDLVTDNMEEIKKKLGPETYQTKTRGERHVAGAKPCGCGVYTIVHHPGARTSSNHTHLAYVLELPEEPGHLQQAFHIEKEASFIISVKNPTKPNPEDSDVKVGLQEEKKAHLPEKLQGEFEGHKFIPVEDVKLMNYQGAEILLIGVAKDHDVTVELGTSAKQMEKTAEEEETHPGTILDKSLFAEMAQRKKPEQIITGEW